MNKKSFLACLLFLISVHLQIFPENGTELFDKIELRFHLKEYTNNYDSEMIRVDGEFTSPSGKTYTMPGFYYADYVKLKDFDCGLDIPCESLQKAKHQPYNWSIRFTPNETGIWKYAIIAQDKNGRCIFPRNKKGNFTCIRSVRTGFITKNNNRYLKKGNDPIFLVGANVAWYGRDAFSVIPVNELGTNDYQRYIDILARIDVNFIKVWINHPASMALVGREWTTGKMHWFDDYNQKDAWQLDQVMEYANKHDINILLCVLQQNSFVNSYGVNRWEEHNAFNSRENSKREQVIQSPFNFFSDEKAIKYTKDLFRYIVARWGYMPNLIAWKLFTEIEQVEKIWSRSGVYPPDNYIENVIKWHNDMADYIRKIDPYQHLITTSSPNKYSSGGKEFPRIWYNMDLTISHDYQGFNNMKELKRFETHLLNRANAYINEPGLHDKPYMVQEWGLTPGNELRKLDPNGYQYHCCLWSSCMTGAFGSVATWEWDSYILKQHLFKLLKPVSIFMSSVINDLDSSMRGYKMHMNGLSVFYATNDYKDMFIGWCQDDNYDFSVIKDTKYIDDLKSSKPKPFSKRNTINLAVNKNKQAYTIQWFDTQTAEIVYEETIQSKGYKIKFSMPGSLRSGTFGDGAFIISTKDISPTIEKNSQVTNPKRIKL